MKGIFHTHETELLSQISSLYHAVGLISQIISKGITLLQGLWKLHLVRDTPVLPEVVSKRQDIKQKFAGIVQLLIPRHVLVSTGCARQEAHA